MFCQNDLVSVIVPVYKTEQYLSKCLDSIINQNYPNVEIIVVDDGSPDKSPVLCDRYADKDARIRVIHKNNGGQSSARNAGLRIASGEYVCFVDSDDYIATDMITTLHTLISKNVADIAKVDYVSVKGIHPRIVKSQSQVYCFEDNDVQEAFLDLNIDSVCTCMYKRELIKDISFIEGKISEDIPFNFQAFCRANRFVYLPQAKYYYVYNPSSTSNGVLNNKKLDYLHFRRQIYDYYKKTENKKLQDKAAALYARAAMGLLTRMALFGTGSDVNEKECREKLRRIFFDHQKEYFASSIISMDRKFIAICSVYFYPFLKLLRIFYR